MVTAIRGFLLGLVVGALFTPFSGRENRRRLMEWLGRFSSETAGEATRRFEEMRPQLQARLGQWSEQVGTTVSTARQRAGEQLTQARTGLPERLREVRETVPGRAVVISGVIREEVSQRLGRRPGEARRREGGEAHSAPETPAEATMETIGDGQPRRGRTRQVEGD